MSGGGSGTGKGPGAGKLFDSVTGLSENSRKMFQTKLDHWVGWFSGKGLGGLKELLRSPQAAMEVLTTAPIAHSPSNHHLYLSAVVSVFRHGAVPPGVFARPEEQTAAFEAWVAIQKANSKPLREHYTENAPTASQAAGGAGLVTWPDVLAVRDKLARGSPERLLVLLYTAIPPVRADHFATEIVLFPGKPTSPNYLLIKSPRDMQIVVRDFKTARTYTEICQALPREVCDEVVANLAASPRKYLFTTEGGQPFDRKRFSEWSGRILTRIMGGRQLNLNALRHLYISANVNFNSSAKTLEKIGNAMGHSIAMQKGYQWIGEGDGGAGGAGAGTAVGTSARTASGTARK